MKKIFLTIILAFIFLASVKESEAQYVYSLGSDSVTNSVFKKIGAYTVPDNWIVDSVEVVIQTVDSTSITRLVIRRGLNVGGFQYLYAVAAGDSITATGAVTTAGQTKLIKIGTITAVSGSNYFEWFIQSAGSGNIASRNKYRLFALVYARRL